MNGDRPDKENELFERLSGWWPWLQNGSTYQTGLVGTSLMVIIRISEVYNSLHLNLNNFTVKEASAKFLCDYLKFRHFWETENGIAIQKATPPHIDKVTLSIRPTDDGWEVNYVLMGDSDSCEIEVNAKEPNEVMEKLLIELRNLVGP